MGKGERTEVGNVSIGGVGGVGGAEISLVGDNRGGGKGGSKKKKEDIKLYGATVSLNQSKSKFTGLHARIIKQHKIGNKGDFSGESGVGVNLETASVLSGGSASKKDKGTGTKRGSTAAVKKNVKTRRAASKKNVKKLMSK